jgi:hypothetical protein
MKLADLTFCFKNHNIDPVYYFLQILTKDSVTVHVDAIMYYKVPI